MEDSEYLRHAVVMLAQEIGVRSWQDRDRLRQTTDYISAQFSSFGLPVSRQTFRFRGNDYDNIIAERTGRISPEKVLVVGAHYDSVYTTPGADDNASGIAGLLGVARLLAGAETPLTVRFVAFCLEEPPAYRSRNMGSYHYARSLCERKEQVEGMICLEMIGYFSDQKGSQHYPLPLFRLKYPSEGNFIAMVGGMRSREFTRGMAAGFRKAVDLPAITLNAPPIIIGIDFSDHWSFGKFGYKAFMVTDTAFYRNPHYHAPTDLPGTLDYERMDKVVQGLVAAIGEWEKVKEEEAGRK